MKSFIFVVPFQIWIIMSVICFGAGELFSKKVVVLPSLQNFILTLFFYILGCLLWLPALAIRKNLGTTGAIWSMMSLIVTVLIGGKYYNEQLAVKNMIGLIFALVAIALCH